MYETDKDNQVEAAILVGAALEITPRNAARYSPDQLSRLTATEDATRKSKFPGLAQEETRHKLRFEIEYRVTIR